MNNTSSIGVGVMARLGLVVVHNFNSVAGKALFACIDATLTRRTRDVIVHQI